MKMKMEMDIYALQGDLIVRETRISKDTANKLVSATNLVVAGSHDGAHVIVGPCMHHKLDDGRIYVMCSADTVITHAARHKDTILKAGTYCLGAQRERGGTGDRAVQD